MKVGDLVVSITEEEHDFGIGLVVRELERDVFGVPRWGVLWTKPFWIMKDGTSIAYEGEVKVINEADKRTKEKKTSHR